MPNHVTNKIVFDVKEAERIFAEVCPDGLFDFNLLVPMPPHVYMGSTSHEDEKDFPINWLTWSRENWGTKWNCYEQSCGIQDGKAFIKFDTAWSVPYPIIVAFCNRFKIPFEHRYFDEGHNFWGIETWKYGEYFDESIIVRAKKDQNSESTKRPLCIELKGYDPDEREKEQDESA